MQLHSSAANNLHAHTITHCDKSPWTTHHLATKHTSMTQYHMRGPRRPAAATSGADGSAHGGGGHGGMNGRRNSSAGAAMHGGMPLSLSEAI